MPIDLSLLRNIDFTDKNTIVFLCIALALVLMVLLIALCVLLEIKKILSQIFKGIFTKKVKNQVARQQNFVAVPAEKIQDAKQVNSPPIHHIKEATFITNVTSGERKLPESADAMKSQQKKETEEVAEALSRLKSESAEKKTDTLLSKMPSRVKLTQNESTHQEIKIPRAKRFVQSTPSLEAAGADVKPDTVVAAQKINQARPENQTNPIAGNAKGASIENTPFFKQADFLKNTPMAPTSRKEKMTAQKSSQAPNEDQSIFQGKPEVSRIDLEREMKKDPNVWRAERQSGLALSPVERAKLVREVFSPVLGRNISKTDLKWSLKKLNQKMLDAKDPVEHTKIRKEIKFFKKIGGVK